MKNIKILLFTLLVIFSIGFNYNSVHADSGSGSVTVTVVYPTMIGTLNPSSPSCTIKAGNDSCNVTLNWDTTNPVGTSAVTAAGMTNVNGNSGGQAFAVPFSSRTFYLYNNAILLDQSTATASCANGTSWNSSICVVVAPTTYTVTGTAGFGGIISPALKTVNSGLTTTFTVTPNSGYSIKSVTGCSGSRSGNTYTTGAITSNCPVTASFSNIKYTVTGTAGSGGSISPTPQIINSGNYATFTVTPNSGYKINSVTGCSGSLSGNHYNTGTIVANCTVTATFLLNSCVNGATNYPTCTTCIAGSTIIGGICTPVTVSVIATTPYNNVTSGANVSFAYTPTTNTGSTECLLLDYNKMPLIVTYKASSPITYAVPNGAGPYAYYIQCRNTTTTSAIAISNQIIVNMALSSCPNGATNPSACTNCPSGSAMIAGICTPITTGTLNATGCLITEGNNSCSTTIDWSITNPVGTTTVRTPNNATGTIVSTGNSGTTTYTIPYPTMNFGLVNNGSVIVSKSPVAGCDSNTHWNGSTKCILNSPTTTFTAIPTTIIKGKSSVLTWSSTSATSCSGSTNNSEVFDTGGLVSGSKTVTPATTTTYTLSCTNASGTDVSSVMTKVINIIIKEN